MVSAAQLNTLTFTDIGLRARGIWIVARDRKPRRHGRFMALSGSGLGPSDIAGAWNSEDSLSADWRAKLLI